MTKHQLIQALKDSQGLSKAEAAKVVDLFFDVMAEALANGDRIEVRGLCSLHVKSYPSYTGRNPRTGKTVTVNAKKLPFFKAGTDLKRRVDG